MRGASPAARGKAKMMTEKKSSSSSSNDFPSLSAIRASLPADVFRPSPALSLYYAARDLALAALLAALGHYLHFSLDWKIAVVDAPRSDSLEEDSLGGGGGGGPLLLGGMVELLQLSQRVLLYGLWCFSLGTVFWGLFVIGHDCGHGSFSRSRWLNLVVGSVTHSVILTPFAAWRATHRGHHKHTGNLDRDEIFQPMRKRAASAALWKYTRNFVWMYFGLGMAWFLYLLFGFAPRNAFGYHFWPLLAPKRSRVDLPASVRAQDILVSHACYAATLFAVYRWAQAEGWWTVAVLYGGPLYVFGSWLVVVTFLHHSDRRRIPWYGNSDWTYVAGQVSTVDRSYGALFDNLTHSIGTHQIHHLFPQIPHYKLDEATAHFRRLYPGLVRTSDESIPVAFVKNAQNYRRHAVVADDATRVVL